MATMDIFNDDAFSMVELTTAIELIPFEPQFLGSLRIFDPDPIRTLAAAIEKRESVLSLIPISQRGAPPSERANDKRDIRYFPTERLAKSDTIYAHEIQSIREFGTETELQQVQAEVARRGGRLRSDVELTHEHMRLGAIQGIVVDADGATVIRNWYTEFGITQPAELNFALNVDTTDVRKKTAEVKRKMMRAAAGAWTPMTQLHALCGDEFYDDLVQHESVKETYRNWSAAQDMRGNLAFESFPFGGCIWHNYRGTDDNSTVAVDVAKAKFFPVGAPEVFKVAWSPGESMEFVNTPGRPVYSMLERDLQLNEWVRLHERSYPLFICTRPEMLQRARKQ